MFSNTYIQAIDLSQDNKSALVPDCPCPKSAVKRHDRTCFATLPYVRSQIDGHRLTILRALYSMYACVHSVRGIAPYSVVDDAYLSEACSRATSLPSGQHAMRCMAQSCTHSMHCLHLFCLPIWMCTNAAFYFCRMLWLCRPSVSASGAVRRITNNEKPPPPPPTPPRPPCVALILACVVDRSCKRRICSAPARVLYLRTGGQAARAAC